MTPLAVLPCCTPTKARAEVLETSRLASAERRRATAGSLEDMIRLESARFLMGSEDADSIPADAEGPVRTVQIDGFYLDRFPVTNARFREFVTATGYQTEAEQFGWSFVFQGHLPPHQLTERVPALRWWRRVDSADWAHPEGPDSGLSSRENHPAVHVSRNDAHAYAVWAGKRLPTEAEWEYAARGGLEQNAFPGGMSLRPAVDTSAIFGMVSSPDLDLGEDGYTGPAPVDAFPENAFGFATITGNVWEWCADWFSPNYHLYGTRSNPVGPMRGDSKGMRGGSYLCHASYCNRYRVAVRTSNTPDSATTNIGFRCALDLD